MDDSLIKKEQQYIEKCSTLGGTHPDTLNSLKWLVYICMMKKEYEKAIEYGEKYYKLICKESGGKEPMWLDTLAKIHTKSGNYDKALELLEQSVNAAKEEFGDDSLFAADSFEKMAEIYETKTDYAKAAQMLKKSYDIKCRAEGENSSSALEVVKKLADMCEKSGNSSHAEELYEKLYYHIFLHLEDQGFGSLNLLKAAEDYFAGKGEYLMAIRINRRNCEITYRYFGESDMAKESIRKNELLQEKYMRKYEEDAGC